ncbi:MAG TPA: 50S ribosomal protein L34e [Candidatus Lokiarchaeia archaeon]|nr:50S ribosomal protein L34e [Candidatus Lokiarchaeia archaeon]
MARHKSRIPSGHAVIHYRRHKPAFAHCKYCGAKLNGVPRQRPAEIRAIAHSSRRPERPYAGNLCPRCLARAIRKAVM